MTTKPDKVPLITLVAEAWSAFTSGLEISPSSSDESESVSSKGPRARRRE